MQKRIHKTTVKRNINEVWEMFLTPDFWSGWYIKGMLGPSPDWQKGNTVHWQDGGVSGILDFVEYKTIQFENTNNIEKWFFTDQTDSTLIQFENHSQTQFPSNYDEMARSLLAKLKVSIDGESEDEDSETIELSDKIDQLVRNLSNRSEKIQYESQEELIEIGMPAMEALITCAEKTRYTDVRSFAEGAIGTISGVRGGYNWNASQWRQWWEENKESLKDGAKVEQELQEEIQEETDRNIKVETKKWWQFWKK